MKFLKFYKELKFFDLLVFNMLLYFVCKIIYFKNNDLVCYYFKLLRWYNVLNFFGEDIFIIVFVVFFDIVNKFKRKYFDWLVYIDYNNKEINVLFKNKMVDFYMYLKGFLYNFDISWFLIMNNIMSMENVFIEVYNLWKIYGWDKDFYVKMYRVCVICLYLVLRIGLLLENV